MTNKTSKEPFTMTDKKGFREYQIKVILLEESVWQSIVKDVVGLATLAALFWFNYEFVGGSYFVNALILGGIVMKIINFTQKQSKMTVKEAKQYLEEISDAPE
jgi:hypothetical protein